MGTATAMMIAIGIVAVVIPIRTAATTDAVLPAADSATAVRENCRHCNVRAPVGDVVVDNDAITENAPEALLLSSSSAMDPTAAATTKTLNGNGDGDGSDGDGNGDGNGGNGNGDGNSNGNGGGGVQWM